MEHKEGTFKGAGGIKLYYQCWMPESELSGVLVFVHGFGDHSGRHKELVRAVVKTNWAFYGFDLRGHGQSPGQRGHINSWDEYRNDLELFIDFVHGTFSSGIFSSVPIMLMGYSMGGLTVLEYGLHSPDHVSGIIAMSPALGDVGVSPFLMLLAKITNKIWPRFSLEAGLELEGVCRDPEVRTFIENDPLSHGKGTPRLATELEKVREWTRENASQMNLPLLLLHGKADRIAYPEETERFFTKVPTSDKTLKLYDGAYHELDSEPDKETVFKDIGEWLKAHQSK